MKKKEIKKLTKQQLVENLEKLKKDLFNFRFQKVSSQITNPSQINQTKKKVWELIKESVDSQVSFGDAKISEKHYNFFINSRNASFENMYNLINFVKSKVKEKTGISLELELEIIN